MPRMSNEEVDAFLHEPGHLVRIGTLRPDGAPLVVPTWFLYRDGKLLVTPRAKAGFWEDLQRDPRTCFSVDEDAIPYRKVTVSGTIEIVHPPGEDDSWRDTYRDIATRYQSEESADAYLAGTRHIRRALIALPLAQAETTTWRMPVPGEEPTGIWAQRYWTP
jgi:nitroimidazol reductase NimA-like FMN-containing flavoprotein (pyridoxamine 5'-phosphate oxidase superfamily)